jgi:hypothetical protein
MSIRVSSTPWIAGAVVVGHQGGGVLAESIPSAGDHGAGYTYSALSFPADNGKEICGRITRWPTLGTLVAREDTSFTYDGASDSFEYQLYVDYVAVGSPQMVSLTFGALLNAAHSSQAAASGTGAIAQTHALAGASSSQSATSGTGAISTGAVAQAGALMAAPSVQDATAAASPIVQRHMLAAANSGQAATSSAGAVSDGSVPVYVAGSVAGGNRAPRIQSGTRAAR